MKYLPIALVLWLSAIPTFALAEVIRNFHSDIQLQEDGTVLVTETIEYDFESETRHGIFREIPVRYRTELGQRSMDIEVKEVLRDGDSEPYEASGRATLNIKIGDPDETITGAHIYTIAYTVEDALNFFEEYDELYWNVTGNGWQIPIEKASASITLPHSDALSTVTTASCYVGTLGSPEMCEVEAITEGVIAVSAGRLLSPSEGLTFAVPIMKGVIPEPTMFDRALKLVIDNVVLVLPLLALVGMYRLWQKRGRDPLGRGTIIAEYEAPESIAPLLSGVLINEKVDARDITAGVIGLAERGFLKIERLEKKGIIFSSSDYRLRLEKPVEELVDALEQTLVKLFFGEASAVGDTIELSALTKDGSFVNRLEALKTDIYQALVDRGWFEKNPRNVIVGYVVLAVITIVLSFVALSAFGVLSTAAGVLTGAIIGIFGFLMPKKTKVGALLKERLQGFEVFLSVTEKDRLAFHNAPEKSPEQFMAFLPYAVAFAVEKKWAEQFKDVYINPPVWYSGAHAAAFSAPDFSSDFSGFTSSMGSAVSHAASGGSGSGGGGSSGGGGGGGGGGSW